MEKYAYIRVSSKDQNIARQVEAMQKLGLNHKNRCLLTNNLEKILNERIIKDYWKILQGK